MYELIRIPLAETHTYTLIRTYTKLLFATIKNQANTNHTIRRRSMMMHHFAYGATSICLAAVVT